MSNAQALPPLPDQKQLNRMLDMLVDRDFDLVKVQGLIKANPGFARTDADWYKTFPDIQPLIFHAIDNQRPEVVEALLNAGSSPNATTHNKRDDNDVIGHAISMASTEKQRQKMLPEKMLRILEILAAQPGPFTHLSGVTRVPTACTASSLLENSSFRHGKSRVEKVVAAFLEKIPDELLVGNAEHHEYYPPSTFFGIANREGRKSAAVMLVERGVDLNTCPPGQYHPFRKMMQDNDVVAAAQLLLCGLSEDSPCERYGPDTTVRGQMAAAGLTQRVHATVNEILYSYIYDFLTGDMPPEKVFFDDKGHVTWQGHALIRFDMLDSFFNPEQAKHFGNANAQWDFVHKLREALPENEREQVKFAGLQRERPLARPDDSATVNYLRGITRDEERNI